MSSKALCLLACYLFVSSTSLLSQTSDSITRMPSIKWQRVRNVDVKHIEIDLRLDWSKKQAYGKTTILLSPLKATDHISLDAGMLLINSIQSKSGSPLKFEYDGSDRDDALQIQLGKSYKEGEELTIIVDYRTSWQNITDPNNLGGSNGKGIRFFEPTPTEPKRRRQAWSMGDAESNRYWFPSFDGPNDLRTTDFKATVDNELTVISNGMLLETKSNEDGTKTFHWRMDKPYPNHRTSFVAGIYQDIQQEYDGIKLHSYGYPDEAEAVKATTVRLPDMMRFYSELTGLKYPHSSYSQAFVQESPWGVGYAGASTHSENMIDDYGTHADFFYLWDGLEAEGVASQWFGNHLFSREWTDSWLNRGISHYLDGLYNEYKNGHEEFLIWQVNGDMATYLFNWNGGARRPVITRNYDHAAGYMADNNSYVRPALFLNMLRRHLGEDKWRKLIKHYVKRHAGGLVTTDDFRIAVEDVSGEPMDWFFDQWLYKMGHPLFEVTKRYDSSASQLILSVKQTQQVDVKNEYPQCEWFKGWVDVEIDDSVRRVWLEAKRDNEFRFECKQVPKLVNFDFENGWIKEIVFDKSIEELLYQLQHERDILARYWAITELVRKYGEEKTTERERMRIYAGIRAVASSGSYWRLRANALAAMQGLMQGTKPTVPTRLDKETIAMLQQIIRKEGSWLRVSALAFLSTTRDAKYADIYLRYLNDSSDRVINMSAIALGRSKSAKAFDALVKLSKRPSWKNQSLISSLYGLKDLNDPRGFELAFMAISDLTSARWTLATPVWDFRIAAAQTLYALGKGERAYPMILDRFRKAMSIDDVNDMFSNALLVANLGDPRGQEVFEELKAKFKDDENALAAVRAFESQFQGSLKKK